jgi:hypothetical protein
MPCDLDGVFRLEAQRGAVRQRRAAVGEAAALASVPPWPPSHAAVNAFCTLFRSSASLGRYFSHIRSVLALLRVPAGELADTARLVRGAEKAAVGQLRPRVWASTAQTRALVKWTVIAGRQDLAHSWTVARHFCLRYSETLALGTAAAPFRFARSGSECILTFMRRKCYKTPVEVTRRCLCADGAHLLCGVCALAEAAKADAEPFSHISYAEALGFLKAGAAALAFPQAPHWGPMHSGVVLRMMHFGPVGPLLYSGRADGGGSPLSATRRPNPEARSQPPSGSPISPIRAATTKVRHTRMQWAS